MGLQVWLPLNKDTNVIPGISSFNKEGSVTFTEDTDGWYKVADSSHTSSRWGIYYDFNVRPSTTYTLTVYSKSTTGISCSIGIGSFQGTVTWPTVRDTNNTSTEKLTTYTWTTTQNDTKARIYLAMNPGSTIANNYVFYKEPKVCEALTSQGLSNVTVTNNGATVDNNGKIGKCYSFSGSSNKITIPFQTAVSSAIGTISCWVKFNSFPTSSTWFNLIQIGASGGFAACRLGMYMEYTNKINISINGSTTGQNVYTHSLTIGKWYHLCATFDGTTVKLYLDGNQVLSKTATIGSYTTSASTMFIGGTNNYYLKGCVNDVRYYDDVLSAQEIKLISKGLVLHYPLLDKYIENTTNLITTEDCLSSTCYNGATSKYNYGDNTNMYKTVGTFQGRKCTKVYNQTSGTGMYPYVYISNMYTSNGTNAPEYKTLSFDYYTTISTSITPYKLGSGSGTATYKVTNTEIKTGTGTNSVTIPVKPNMWNHIEVTFHGTTDANAQWGYIQNNPSHTANTSNYWLFANMQLEAKDHATGYAGVNSTRTATTAKDASGFGYNGTLTGTFIISTDAPKYNASTVFSSNAIKKSDFSIGNVWSAGIWFYPLSTISSGWDMLFGLNSSGGDADIKLGIWYNNTDRRMEFEANGQYDSTSVVIPSKDAWYYAMETFDGTTLSMYLNGELKKTKSITNAELIKSNLVVGGRSSSATLSSITSYFRGKLLDFRIYATALSANDVLELYNNKL